uniref:Vomeronasal type-1 receptor n=1 Tax=Suricata suricatta TaxID=37032 RepID=A0A673UYQ6_SURSU
MSLQSGVDTGRGFPTQFLLTELTTILWFVSDAVFISLMVWSSGSTVLPLHGHRQRTPHIHTPTGYRKCPPETRAAHTIPMLEAIFVNFYVLNFLCVFYVTAFFDFHLWLIETSNILALCFPTFGPLLLILQHPGAPRSCS